MFLTKTGILHTKEVFDVESEEKKTELIGNILRFASPFLVALVTLLVIVGGTYLASLL